ncbi:sensor histidine kinase [Nocardia macrotermitis]|uniref:sensor histidine kinase n=1 Tax=Nocardia macrotermitis TaxID=2585198 RepID=UPI0029E8091B|nr:histidine kinase [Nocardia macrotermitis]
MVSGSGYRQRARLPRLFASARDVGSAEGGDLAGVLRSLARQSMLVAVATAILDTVILALSGIFTVAPGPAIAVTAAIAAADLAFAAAPRTAGIVAVAQVVLRLAGAVVLHGHGLPVRVGDVGFLIAGYRAGAWLSGRASLIIVPLLGAGACGSALITPLLGSGACRSAMIADAPDCSDWRRLAVTAVSTGVLPWLVGRYTTARGAYIAELEQRERLRQQEQRAALDRALSDEREAIARDLHDVISHHVSAIGIHAGAARMALTTGPPPHEEAATRSLAAVEASSRAAMVDLRRQLDLLHGRDEAGRRQPGLADIEELATHVRDTGLDLTLHTTGPGTPLPESLDVTVYRIVQEMLTNALRHGDGRAELTVREHHDRVLITETNPLAAQPDTTHSLHRGLDGIRRRAELFGGTVDYGVERENRWRITVSLPLGGT